MALDLRDDDASAKKPDSHQTGENAGNDDKEQSWAGCPSVYLGQNPGVVRGPMAGPLDLPTLLKPGGAITVDDAAVTSHVSPFLLMVSVTNC